MSCAVTCLLTLARNKKVFRPTFFDTMSQENSTKKSKKNFLWSDDETALLVQVIIDYKSTKASIGLDWESIKSKYEDITERLQSRYPKPDSGLSEAAFPYSNDPSVFTKDRIIPKVKRLKANFRKAVDSGRRSGGGKIVMGLYNECCEIWSGSPAVESVSFGIESSSIDTLDSMENSNLSEGIDYSPTSNANQAEAEIDVETRETEPKNMAKVRRELARNLKERRDSRLTKRLSVEAQLLDTAKQEIALKKRALERIEELDANHKEEKKMFQESITTLTNTIADGFNMLHQVMQSQVPIHPQPFYSYGPQNFQRSGFVMDNRSKSFLNIIEDPGNFN